MHIIYMSQSHHTKTWVLILKGHQSIPVALFKLCTVADSRRSAAHLPGAVLPRPSHADHPGATSNGHGAICQPAQTVWTIHARG